MRIIHLLIAAVSAGAVFVAGYEMGALRTPEAPSEEVEVRFAAKQQIQDAMSRWSVKAKMSEEDVRQHWSPRSMFIPTHNQGSGMTCIQLRIEQGALGGEPVYCYTDDTTKLAAEYSDVE